MLSKHTGHGLDHGQQRSVKLDLLLRHKEIESQMLTCVTHSLILQLTLEQSQHLQI